MRCDKINKMMIKNLHEHEHAGPSHAPRKDLRSFTDMHCLYSLGSVFQIMAPWYLNELRPYLTVLKDGLFTLFTCRRVITFVLRSSIKSCKYVGPKFV